jgi:metal-sulfur cluster biosynthetic enzyme
VSPTAETVRDRLDAIVDPCSAANGTDLSIVEMGLLKDVTVDGSDVTVSLRLTSPFCMQLPYFVENIEEEVGAIDDVGTVDVEADNGFEWHSDMMTESAQQRREERKAARREAYFDDDTLENVAAEH